MCYRQLLSPKLLGSNNLLFLPDFDHNSDTDKRNYDHSMGVGDMRLNILVQTASDIPDSTPEQNPLHSPH